MRSKIDKILESILSLLMALLVVDVVWQVLSRYVLYSPSSVTDEIATFLLIWVGLLGAAYCFGCGEHLAIDIFTQSFNPKNKRRVSVVINMFVFAFALFVLIIGGGWLVYTRFYLDVTSASLQLNMGYIYLVLPLSGVITLYYALCNIFSVSKEPQEI